MKLLVATLCLLSTMSLLPTSALANENPPLSSWIDDTSGGTLNTETHVYWSYAQINPKCAAVTGANIRVVLRSYGADALTAQFRGDLPAAWKAATRGLGTLTVVTAAGDSYDMEIRVTGGTGQSEEYRCSERYFPPFGSVFEQNLCPYPEGCEPVPQMVVLLHEIGHFWCCYGPGARKGHWIIGTTADLMTDPGPTTMHPFSDRELRTMGLLP